jgi:hypothetical protein
MALELDPTAIAALKILGFDVGAAVGTRNIGVEITISADHDESKLWLSITYCNNDSSCRGTNLLFLVNRCELLEAAVCEAGERSQWKTAKPIPDKWPEKRPQLARE